MRRRATISIAVGVLLLLASAYAEFVLDLRTRHSAVRYEPAISTSSFMFTADYQRIAQEMRDKYGQSAKTAYRSGDKFAITTVGDQIVEQTRFPVHFAGALALFVVRPPDGTHAVFPVSLTIGPGAQDSRRSIADGVKFHFGKSALAEYTVLADADWSVESCRERAPADLGLATIAAVVKLSASQQCMISWRGAAPATMLVGMAVSDGGDWVRVFSRRLCRALTSAWIGAAAAASATPPTYVACILVDRADRYVSGEKLVVHAFEVASDKAVLRMD
jgi:hypothetical protein